MLFKSLGFEAKYLIRQPSFFVTVAVFFLLPFLATVSDNVQIGGGGNVLYNGSFAIAQTMLILSVFALFLLVNFVGGTATRNHTSNMSELIYTRPLNPMSYQMGRFLGAYVVTLVVFAAVPLGVLIGTLMPWIDQERVGPTHLSFYLTIFGYIIVPGFLALGMIFYAIALRLRSMMGTYLVAMGLFIAWIVTNSLIREPAYRAVTALFDPFALVTFGEITRYWTVFDKNTAAISLTDTLLYNRLIWLSFGAAFIFLVGGLHKMQWASQGKKSRPTKASRMPAPVGNRINLSAASGHQIQKFFTRLGFEMRQVLLSPALIVLLIFTVFNLSSIYFVSPGAIYGTPDWPLTKNMVAAITDNFGLMLFVVITYYSGEIVWRERGSGMGDIIDATPAFNLVFWASKIIALWAVIASLYVVGMLFTLLFQIAAGYSEFEFDLYFVELFYINLVPWCLMGVLAFFIQTLSPNKYVGMLILVAYFISSLVFQELGLEHTMWSYGDTPPVPYSDLNGHGWFLTAFNWYLLYWAGLALVLSTLGYALWQRGPEAKLKQRLKLVGYHLGAKGKTVLALGLVVFIASGGYIHYNTKVLNQFIGAEQGLDLRAQYEREFSQYEDANIPVITDVNAKVDIYPYERRIEASAEIRFNNKGQQPIERVLLSLPDHTQQWQVEIEGVTVGEPIEDMRSVWLTFDQPLAVGESREGVISVTRAHQGFKDRGFDFEVAENGTFINNYSLFPSFGVDQNRYIVDRHERRKQELPERPRAHKLEDSSRYQESFFGKGVGFINFETTVSTAGDQIAIAPGYLQKRWEQDGRNYFHYKMDAPIVNFFAYLSARHDVIKDEHNGVNLEIYYDPKHAWNLDIMMQSMKDSLDYFTTHFGPYQHRQMRIIEFPGYRSFAQSFANTVPYSEGIGFTANLTNPEDIDYVYYVTAHEMAHQWWGHQVGAANVQGSAIISESLSQYSAIMVLMERYGKDKMRKFIKYELDRYLSARGSELLEEMPFMRSENQSYIHYRKGSVVMMALLDRLGEQRVNQALKSMIEQFRFSDAPYPTTLDLQAAFNQVADEQEQAFIADLFERITLYDIKIEQGNVVEKQGKFEVTLEVEAKRFVADGDGREQEQPLEEWVDIVLFSEDPDTISVDNQVLYQQKHKLRSGTNSLVIELDQRPSYAGADPFVTLIDRVTSDNIIKL